NKKSILVYGDNGTGKSSVTDALEWFYFDRIEHLSNEEIGRKQGRDALRNIFIPDDEDGYIEIQYSNNKLDATKSIDSNLSPAISNSSSDFQDFIISSQSENLILRYRDLVKFIIAGKTDKLKELQKIIGFSEVADIRDLLRKNGSRIGRTIRAAGYDSQKSAKQQVVLDNLGQNAFTDKQFTEGATELIKPLKLGKTIKSIKDIKGILKSIETKVDTAIIEQISFHTRVGENLIEIHQKEKKQVEKDIREIAGITQEDVPVILDIESVRVTGAGKFEIDLANLFKKDRPLIYKLEEGKYIIDLASTLDRSISDTKDIKPFELETPK
ncbi:MAG: AAA family ATPase, partial [Planctomycetes bacterium]|nr:AAA family ATPase [Planctomycetota bacterium]